jgi:predicted N-acyltransferase
MLSFRVQRKREESLSFHLNWCQFVTVDFLRQGEYPIWDAFVAQHPLGLIYHLSSWKEMLERAFSHIKGHFLVLRDESGKIIAGIPVYAVKSWLLGNRLVSIPYASICDPLITGVEQYQKLLPALVALQKETTSHSIEIRTIRTLAWISDSSSVASNLWLHHYLPLDRPLEELRERFSYSVRRSINRAQRDGLQVRQEMNESACSSFHQLSMHTRRRLGLPPIPFSFFDSMRKSFGSSQMVVFTAAIHGKTIGAWLTLHFRDTLHLEYYGAIPQAYKEGASYLLTWEAIRHACSVGCELVSFGRTDPWNEGLLNFKRRWVTIEEPIGISRILVNGRQPARYKSVKRNMISRWVFSNAPQPLREALASFIYRHHG